MTKTMYDKWVEDSAKLNQLMKEISEYTMYEPALVYENGVPKIHFVNDDEEDERLKAIPIEEPIPFVQTSTLNIQPNE